MDQQAFTDQLNRVCKETNSSVILHRTPLKNFQNILKYGGIFPLQKIEKLNTKYDTSFISNYNLPKGKALEKYSKLIFLSLKTPSHKTEPYEIFGDTPVSIIINPRDLNGLLSDSHICYDWWCGRNTPGYCVKYNETKDFDENLKTYVKYIDKKYTKDSWRHTEKNLKLLELGESSGLYNELVIKNPEGIVFDSLEHNPTIVIQESLLSKEEVLECKNLEKTYTQYNWIYIK